MRVTVNRTTPLQVSPNLRVICDSESGSAFVYHSLYGNPRLLNAEALDFLHLFERPATSEQLAGFCEADPIDIVKSFADLLFLIPPGFDERVFLVEVKEAHLEQLLRAETVDRIGLAISDACNFGCNHCIHFQPSTESASVLPLYQLPPGQLNMTWGTAKQCIDKYADIMHRTGQRHGKVHFGDAEPLINWPVMRKVLEYCSSLSGLEFSFAVNTNLTLLTRQMAEVLREYSVYIATSLDGGMEANDAIRRTKGGRRTFRLIARKLDLLAEIGYPLDGFSITVTSRNYDLIDFSAIDVAIERGMTSVAFDYDLVSVIDIPVDERVEKLMQLKRYANGHGIDFHGTWDSPFRNLTSRSLLREDHAFCAAVEGRALQFNVDGSLKICGHTTTRVGHVDKFEELFRPESQYYNLVADRFPGNEAYCAGCEIEGACGGQCHVTREVLARSSPQQGERLFRDMCEFYRTVTRRLAQNYIQFGEVEPRG